MITQSLAVLALFTAAQAQKIQPAEAFKICDRAESQISLIVTAWQLSSTRAEAMELTRGSPTYEAVVADLYDYRGPPRGRSKQAFLLKWRERCSANPEAFILPEKKG